MVQMVCHRICKALLLVPWVKYVMFRKTRFKTTDACIGCGICKRVCPVNNIKIVDSKPVWQDRCSRCLACFHWCPQKAVMVGKKFSRRHQYHHPEISVKDMD